MKDNILKRSGFKSGLQGTFQENTPSISLQGSKKKSYSDQANAAFVDIPSFYEATPSGSGLNLQIISKSRQPQVRGFFLREQQSRDEALRQIEIKRRTKEILDHQILEKKSLQFLDQRELQIRRFQDTNLTKQSSMLDRMNDSKSRSQLMATETGTTTQVYDDQDQIYSRSNINTKSLGRGKEKFEADPIQIQEILKENDELKQLLSQKNQVIDALVIKNRVPKETFFREKPTEMEPNFNEGMFIKKKFNYLSPSGRIQRDSDKMATKRDLMSRNRQSLPHRRLNFNQVVSFNGSQLATPPPEKYLSSLDIQFPKTWKDKSSLIPMKQQNFSNHDESQSLNNFTFASNLVEKLKRQQCQQQKEQKMRILKEFSQDNLRRKFCV